MSEASGPSGVIWHRVPETRWPTAEAARMARWFQPIQLNTLVARTRTWVPAMVPWRATPDGFVNEDVLAWYERFARGRPGVLVVEATGIRDIPSGPLLRIGDDRFVPGLRQLVDVVRAASRGATRLFIQVIDFLAVKRRPTQAMYCERYLALRPEHRSALAARGLVAPTASDADVRAALTNLDAETTRAVLDAREFQDFAFGYRESVNDEHLPHIRALPHVLPKLFADASARAQDAGFDGVELHFAHAYTMASFLSRTNTRRDGYGSDPAGRVRLPREVVGAVRARVGASYCVGTRILGDEVIDGGSRVDDACFYACELVRAGLDYVSVSKGGKFDDARQPRVGEAVYPYTGPSGHECMPTVRSDARGPFGRNVPLAAAVRASLRAAELQVPVITSGGIASFEQAEQILADGAADIVAAARQSLADPDWFAKVEAGRGDEVRRCKFTNYCEGLDQRHKQVTCQLWDREFTPDCARSSDGKRRLLAP